MYKTCSPSAGPQASSLSPSALWLSTRIILGGAQKCFVLSLVAQLCLIFETPWTAAHQAPLSMGILKNSLEWVAIPSSRGIFPTQGSNPVSSIAGTFFTI